MQQSQCRYNNNNNNVGATRVATCWLELWKGGISVGRCERDVSYCGGRFHTAPIRQTSWQRVGRSAQFCCLQGEYGRGGVEKGYSVSTTLHHSSSLISIYSPFLRLTSFFTIHFSVLCSAICIALQNSFLLHLSNIFVLHLKQYFLSNIISISAFATFLFTRTQEMRAFIYIWRWWLWITDRNFTRD